MDNQEYDMKSTTVSVRNTLGAIYAKLWRKALLEPILTWFIGIYASP